MKKSHSCFNHPVQQQFFNCIWINIILYDSITTVKVSNQFKLNEIISCQNQNEKKSEQIKEKTKPMNWTTLT